MTIQQTGFCEQTPDRQVLRVGVSDRKQSKQQDLLRMALVFAIIGGPALFYWG